MSIFLLNLYESVRQVLCRVYRVALGCAAFDANGYDNSAHEFVKLHSNERVGQSSFISAHRES